MTTSSQVKMSVHAMATRFELGLVGDDPVRLRAAGEEALEEIERLERQLSFYRPDSEIKRINSEAASRPVKVEPRLFRLLQTCSSLTALTDGAFDITVGPLMRAWGLAGGSGELPTATALEAARAVVGVDHVDLDEARFTVRFKRAGVELDLGGFGKGYAIERAIDVLRDNGITSALLHGGTSSVCAIGSPPDESAWRIGLNEAFDSQGTPHVVTLCDAAMSVSAIQGKSFVKDGRVYGHVIDPRSGEPVMGTSAAVVVGPSPSVCEALSKAVLVLGPEWLPRVEDRFPGYTAVAAAENSNAINGDL
jgi:thiamine biosynthesis lipoprotein